MQSNRLDTQQKAIQINLDNSKYGTFAEIGAGQEVARWFFRVGGAAGTIAKSISAYDMTVSDAIYGESRRYVSRQRLETMLDLEYGSLTEHLARKRGETTRFFVFADTVAAKSFTRQERLPRLDGHPVPDPARLRALADPPPRQPPGSREPLPAGGHGHPGREPDPLRPLRGRRRWS